MHERSEQRHTANQLSRYKDRESHIGRPLGPIGEENGRRQFRVWAPKPSQIDLVVLRDGTPERHPMREEAHGYRISEPVVAPTGTRYGFYLNGDTEKLYPDPASRYQPDGVHAASEVMDLPTPKLDDWKGRGMAGSVIYELHLGTFTPEGTLAAAAAKLDYLADLGINVVELMPLNQTPGGRNWGYDGVYPFALQHAYGRPEDLVDFIDAAHARGIAVIIDVIYNHLGPEGNYLPAFMPVFTEQHKTPWGAAVNFDDVGTDGVRNYWLQNVRLWLEQYGADGLRLDAVHAIKDYSAEHFLESLSRVADEIGEKQGREMILLAECDLNAPRYILPREQGGYGLSGQWVDEFHHALHALLTEERIGYYEDFGELEHLERALRDGYVYTGQYSVHRGRNFGRNDYRHQVHPAQFAVFLQNHDQVGNRMEGDRLLSQVGREKFLLGAMTYLLSPFTPLIWMGEEYGETRPFPYFVNHQDPKLIEAVRKGRAREFAAFQRPGHTVPDPQSEATFASAKLSWQVDTDLLDLYRRALHLRPRPEKFDDIHVERHGNLLHWQVNNGPKCYANFGQEPLTHPAPGRLDLTTHSDTQLQNGKLHLPPFTFAATS